MKKSLSLVLCAFMLLSLFATAFAFAESNSGSDDNDSSDSEDSDDDSEVETESETEVNVEDDGRVKIEEKTRIGGVKREIKTELRADGEFRQEIREEVQDIMAMEREKRIAELRARLRASNGTIDIDKIRVKINGLDEEQKEIIAGRINAKTGLNLTAEDIDGNASTGAILRAYLSNGNQANVRVLPDRAADIAVQRLRAKCNQETNCTVELKEVGTGNKTRAVYIVETENEARAFLFFKRKMIVSAEIDPETGKVIDVRKPWWAFFAVEKRADVETELEVETETEVEANDSEDITSTMPALDENVTDVIVVANDSDLAAV